MPVTLVDRATGASVMEITEAQLQQLQDVLEEEFEEDHDYYLTPDTLDYLLANGVDAGVVEGLRAAIGTREGFDVAWRAAGAS